MLKLLKHFGLYFIMMKKVMSMPEKWSAFRSQLVLELEKVGINSIGIVIFISFFVGGVVSIGGGFCSKHIYFSPSMLVIQAIKKHATKPLDVHLMIEKPERYIEEFAKIGADIITVHYEATVHLHRTLTQIEDAGCKAGVVLNLTTPVSVLEDILPKCYMVLLMSINPGFGGQKFEEMTYEKVRKLRKMADDQGLKTHIEIDGGVTTANARKLIDAGADVLVAGNFVFKSDNPTKTIADLKAI